MFVKNHTGLQHGDAPRPWTPTRRESNGCTKNCYQSGDSSELAAKLPCKGKSVRNRGVSQKMLFLVIPRCLLRGGFIGFGRIGRIVTRIAKMHRHFDAVAGRYAP